MGQISQIYWSYTVTNSTRDAQLQLQI